MYFCVSTRTHCPAKCISLGFYNMVRIIITLFLFLFTSFRHGFMNISISIFEWKIVYTLGIAHRVENILGEQVHQRLLLLIIFGNSFVMIYYLDTF